MGDHLDLGCHHLLRQTDFLYRRVLPAHLDGNRVTPAHCPTKQWREGLSCDWSVLSAPDETALRKGRSLPAHILCIRIGECHELRLDVRHAPVVYPESPDYNLAHCLLLSPDSSKAGIARLRDAFLERANLIRVDWSRLLCIRRALRSLNLRRWTALRYIESHGAQAP